MPNAAVNGVSGRRCSRACSSASISTGARRVTRCGRALISRVNTAQAASNSAKLPYSPRRFASVGTRSAFATRTVASDPPLEAGSAGMHVAMLRP